MKAHVEWVTGVIRAGPEFNDFGDPFEFSCTVVRFEDECFVIGANGRMTFETYRAIRKALEECGIKKATWKRISGKQVEVKGRQ